MLALCTMHICLLESSGMAENAVVRHQVAARTILLIMLLVAQRMVAFKSKVPGVQWCPQSS